MTLFLDGNSLTLEQFYSIATDSTARVALISQSIANIQKSRAVVDEWVQKGTIIYGVTTGFGEFANVYIEPHELEELQENLIISHAVGAGSYLSDDAVRGMMILRINALAKGYSGIRLETVEALVGMLNANLIPLVPSQGSVGSSGDLVQLSHIALALIGRGRVRTLSGEILSSDTALRSHGIEPIRLQAKEGLALINGTQLQCSLGSLATRKALYLMEVADVIGALSADALRSTDKAYHPLLHQARGMVGQMESAKNLRSLMADSEIRNSHIIGDDRVQDAYSIRCMPQVHGASRDAIRYVEKILSIELNAATDNPLIFPDEGLFIEGGNFHGQPLAVALDVLGIACAELCNISERRTERMVNGALSNGLPRFLTKRGGVQSGMMIAQYTAASIVSENKVLAHPASVDSIPTSANQEDHNSMGSISARKALQIVENLQSVLAVELLCSAQAIEFHRPLTTSAKLERIVSLVRSKVPFAETDRILHTDLEDVRTLIGSAEFQSTIIEILN